MCGAATSVIRSAMKTVDPAAWALAQPENCSVMLASFVSMMTSGKAKRPGLELPGLTRLFAVSVWKLPDYSPALHLHMILSPDSP